ncbi:MAG: CvpA family protein [Lentimicrobiaceae bacterium]|nr:CvpA family protein [Lentimicrobiaceae bacterium]MCO5266782.1 CvpA family protein [Lentimicrobium sp.]
MNYIDIFILAILAIAAVKGFSKGLVIEVASLAGMVLGVILSLKFAGYVELILKDLFSSQSSWMYFLAFLCCFALVVIVVHAIAKSIEKIVEIAALGFLNRFAGAAFGILKSAFVLSAIIYFIVLFNVENRLISREQQEKSMFYKPLEGFLPAVLPFLKTKFEQLKNDESDSTEKTTPA